MLADSHAKNHHWDDVCLKLLCSTIAVACLGKKLVSRKPKCVSMSRKCNLNTRIRCRNLCQDYTEHYFVYASSNHVLWFIVCCNYLALGRN